MAIDSTADSFPTYAQLTETQAWAGGAPVPIKAAGATGTAEPSDGSRYTESAVLGVGGMGKVMLVRDARIGRDVALKLLHAERELADEERARFLREAQVQGQLEHPSIVPVYDIDRRPDGTTFFTMRRVLGRTLHAILDDLRAGSSEATARYTQRELLQAFATVCLTVDYAHSRGVVHRDLKPANIMLGDFGEVYVLDWGLARILDASDTQPAVASRLSLPGSMMGTPLYMAPEQMADPEVGPAADVYSLGAILFEILTLLRVRDPRALYAPVDARPSERAPDREVAPELETICVKATQSLVDERYGSARALQEAVARYLEGDRETEQRRVLAAGHAARAREALRRADEPGPDHERERSIAIKELGRALALDPSNTEHVATFAAMMGTLPRTPPPEVTQKMAAITQDVIRSGARYTTVSVLSWFVFLPLIFALGIRRLDYTLAIAVPVAVTSLLAFIASRQVRVGMGIQYAMTGSLVLATISLSRIFGPLILMPTMLAAWTIVAQAHPDRRLRIYGLVLATAGMIVPLALELAGVLPASYVFEHGRMQVLPQMTELPREITLGFLALASLAIAIVPALFVAKLRGQLSELQERQLVQAWHFRRLPDDLIRAGSR